jgi:hypothetical protein
MKIVTIGGAGLIGSTLAILRQGRHEVVAASPRTGINSISDEGPERVPLKRNTE